MDKVIVVTGPTASGKTDLSISLAHRFGGEIISADSMQVYRSMDIGTAKPTLSERDGIAHHMIDVALPSESYSVSRYCKQAQKCVEDVLRRKKVPIICGGTGLYINSLISGQDFAQSGADSGVRNELELMWDEKGAEHMMQLLREVDCESYQKLHINDKKRIIRAIEVFKITGRTISEHNESTKNVAPKYDALMIGLKTEPRQILYDRINERVTKMLNQGLLNEVKSLYEQKAFGSTGAQAIGYKEFEQYLKGEHSLEQATELLARRSRNYAKRQLTWFSRDQRIKWIIYNNIHSKDDVFQKATKIISSFDVEW